MSTEHQFKAGDRVRAKRDSEASTLNPNRRFFSAGDEGVVVSGAEDGDLFIQWKTNPYRDGLWYAAPDDLELIQVTEVSA